MFEVAILGAGELGGALAYRLAKRDLVSAIRLIDEAGTIAAGKALDIMQAGPIEGFSTRVSGSSELALASGAHLVVVAERAIGGEWNGEEGLALLKRLNTGTPPLVLCAGATQREMIERGVREIGLPRAGIFGSAPEALAGAVRAIVALEADVSVSDLAIPVLGIPPDRTVVPWADALRCKVAEASIGMPLRRRIESRIASLWPPGPHALAAAAVRTIESIVEGSRRSVSVFVAPDDSAGRRMRAAAVPARFHSAGITSIEMPELTPHDRVAFDTATLL